VGFTSLLTGFLLTALVIMGSGGLTWLPPWLIKRDLDAGHLVHIFSDQPSLKSDVNLVWLDTPYMARRLRLAIDALVASIRYLNTPMEIVPPTAEISSTARAGTRALTRSTV
jgi:DNA-binding transcriptional LysR family regulator